MELEINHNMLEAKKRKKENIKLDCRYTITDVQTERSVSNQKTTEVANARIDKQREIKSDVLPNSLKLETSSKLICTNRQHILHNTERKQMRKPLPTQYNQQRVPLFCYSDCEKPLFLANPSLYLLYFYLGTLTLALITLSLLFYSHVTAVPTSPSILLTNLEFREQFRRELFESDDIIRSIVMHVMQQDIFRDVKMTAVPTTKPTPHGNRNFMNNGGKWTSIIDLNLSQRTRRDISSSPTSMHADPFIEFFNPNHRKVLEAEDMVIRKRTGLKGSAPGGDEWIYLNTYCRVPEKIITGFCKGTQEYCPPSPQGPPGTIGPKGPTGPQGLPGIPGPKGNRGEVGLTGPPGIDGSQGFTGPRGPKGDIGIPGRAGLDGRDGVPGEPGLDGVPGRAGADGIPGKDGIPGRDGRDGLNGKDGKDGAPGPKGAQGPPGERGLKGTAGPRGRPGKAGVNGTPGIPGINAWRIQFNNGSYSNDLLVPPSIADINIPHIKRTIIVEEGKSLNISCAASGKPFPRIEWRRDDSRTVNMHGVEMSSVNGPFLVFNNISRNQMAAYTCIADNGIMPVANATYIVEVHFSPMISVYRQMIYAEYGHSATLECLVSIQISSKTFRITR